MIDGVSVIDIRQLKDYDKSINAVWAVDKKLIERELKWIILVIHDFRE